MLEGRAGMGKSSLLAEVRRRAGAAGLATCSARGSELENEFAFGVVRQLFEPAIAALSAEERAQVFEGAGALAEPVLDIRGEAAAGGQFAALHGLYWLAANLAARAPLLLAADDVHWADAASLRWLSYLLNRLEGLPMLVAIATRPAPPGSQDEELAVILAHPAVRILTAGPLQEDSVAALTRTTLGADPDPGFTAACLRATAGNPLGVSELLRELRAGGVAPTSAAAAGLEGRAPDAIARRVMRDLSLLGDEAERLARALAVIGDGTELRLIARLADVELDRASEATDDLLSVDLIAPERPPHFAHPLLRSAVYDRLPAGVRQKLHREAAEILRSEGADPEAVAAHLLRCEAGTGSDMIECLRAASPLALWRGAPEAAVSYLRRALAETSGAGMRAAVLAELGLAELAAGDQASAAHLREALVGTVERRARGALLGDLALALLMQNDESGARKLLAEALGELRDCDPDGSTRLECIVTGLSASDLRAAPTVGNHYPRLRELAGGRTPNAELARVTLAMLLSMRDGDRKQALSWIGRGFDWNAVFDGSPMHPFAMTWSILALVGIDELVRAVQWTETVIREATATGYLGTVVIGMVFKAYAECRLGLLAEAEADATAALELSQGPLPYFLPLIRAFLAEILLERGRQEAAHETIEGAGRHVSSMAMEATVLDVRGRLRYLRGWRQRGVDDLRASGKVCEALQLQNPFFYPWRASLASVLVQDDGKEARRLAEEDLADARRSGIPRAIGVALRTLARLDRKSAIDLLHAAIIELHESPAPLDLARTLLDLGALLRRQGHRVEAREPLREALDIAARCGAVPLMERAQGEALAAGARPRRPRLRGVDALTPSELRVARLAAEGRSNREIAQALFITMNTVADHLGSAYSKLDITSRAQLTTALDLSAV